MDSKTLKQLKSLIGISEKEDEVITPEEVAAKKVKQEKTRKKVKLKKKKEDESFMDKQASVPANITGGN